MPQRLCRGFLSLPEIFGQFESKDTRFSLVSVSRRFVLTSSTLFRDLILDPTFLRDDLLVVVAVLDSVFESQEIAPA